MRSLFVSHIVLTTEDVANVLLDHLREYDDPKVMIKAFARLAKKYSACGSRHNGGELGWMEVHTSAPEFFEAAQAAKAHELSGPVKTTFGYHIFIITEEEAVGDTGIDGLNAPCLGGGDGTLQLPTVMKLDGVHHIALNVKDLDRAEKFYTEVLGFSVTHRFSKGLRHLMLDTGNAAIALFEAPDLETREPLDQLSETGYMHLAFKTTRERFDQIIAEMKEKQVTIDNGPVRRGDGDSIYFNDPDFNHLEIHCKD